MYTQQVVMQHFRMLRGSNKVKYLTNCDKEQCTRLHTLIDTYNKVKHLKSQ